MALLSENVRLQVAERLKPMTDEVTLVLVYRDDTHDPHEKENAETLRALVNELAETSDLLHVKELEAGSPEAQALALERYPVLVLQDSAGTLHRVLFSGLPAGYEFATLLEDILDLGAKRELLSAASREKLAAIDSKVHIMVFTTPT